MKFLEYLQEKWVDDLKAKHRDYYKKLGLLIPLFVNPSNKELRECGSTIRFIIDFKKKKIYCWNGDQLVHWEVAKYLQDNGVIPPGPEILAEPVFWRDFFAGVGSFTNGKIEFLKAGDYFTHGDLEEIGWLDNDLDWLNIYFTKPFINTFKRIYGYWL